ncbi:syndecan isoform X7 [Drosophila hydei]|uniref:Syndecan n=1 Tax=Drosophila hydei TaxID=7224 RepID=A0A6J2SZP2_DROHY|nr:syndecan isoform X7 [Drosophila hydei]
MKSKLKTVQPTLTSPSPMASNGKWMLVSAMLLVLLVAATQAADEKSVKASASAPASSSSDIARQAEEIYIDDDGNEGSGGRGGIHDDLEKEADYSGSGFGPDDEDAVTDHHSSSHNTRVHNADNTNTGGSSGSGNVHELDPNTNINSQPTDTKINEHRPGGSGEVVIMSEEDRTTSFFAQPGILAAVIGGAVVGLLCAILVVMFIVYRMRKKDEGSYALDEPKRSPANNSYAKNANNREFYA